MSVMCKTDNGFVISEKDLEIKSSRRIFWDKTNMVYQNLELQIYLWICQY